MSADEKYFSYSLEMSTELDWIVCLASQRGGGRRKKINKR